MTLMNKFENFLGYEVKMSSEVYEDFWGTIIAISSENNTNCMIAVKKEDLKFKKNLEGNFDRKAIYDILGNFEAMKSDCAKCVDNIEDFVENYYYIWMKS